MPGLRCLGLLHGMSRETKGLHYRLATELARERVGGLHSAQVEIVDRLMADGAEGHSVRRSGSMARVCPRSLAVTAPDGVTDAGDYRTNAVEHAVDG